MSIAKGRTCKNRDFPGKIWIFQKAGFINLHSFNNFDNMKKKYFNTLMSSKRSKSKIRIFKNLDFCICLHESKKYLLKIIPCKISLYINDPPRDSFMTINKLIIEAMKILGCDENKTNTNGGTLGTMQLALIIADCSRVFKKDTLT
jgi:hypothetical protein